MLGSPAPWRPTRPWRSSASTSARLGTTSVKVAFVRADIRNPVIGKVIKTRGVETVVHMAIVAKPGTAGRSSMKEINVIGTMQLLAACQKADSFRKLVVQSSVSVYGASPRDPVKFTEDMSPRVQPRTGFAKDSLEIESYVRGLGRRRPDVAVTTLRLGNLMGAGVDSQMTGTCRCRWCRG